MAHVRSLILASSVLRGFVNAVAGGNLLRNEEQQHAQMQQALLEPAIVINADKVDYLTVNGASNNGRSFWLDLKNQETNQTCDDLVEGLGTGAARLAVDGNTDPSYKAGSCTHTCRTDYPTWEVALPRSYRVKTVQVTNRGRDDSHSWKRLVGFDVLVDNAPCASNQPIGRGETVDVPCNARGSSVQIRLPKKNEYLTLCEVAVEVQL